MKGVAGSAGWQVDGGASAHTSADLSTRQPANQSVIETPPKYRPYKESP